MPNPSFDYQLKSGDVLLIVPPFADMRRASIGVHGLQACAAEKGYRVSVLYGNLILAAMLGEFVYQEMLVSSERSLILERFFGVYAYGLDPLSQEELGALKIPQLREMDRYAAEWLDIMERIIFQGSFRVVGASTTFEQTSASVAVLKRCKERDPDIITILGGANCEDEMAEGIHSLRAPIDHVFSGESETTFLEFLQAVFHGAPPRDRIFYGQPHQCLETLPTPDYTEFFDQVACFIPDSKIRRLGGLMIPYESSRGCWWGQKNHCTFCGLNGNGMGYRLKSADRVIEELRHLTEKHETRRITMVDNIMPYNYFKTLLPRLAETFSEKRLYIFYEQKANITLEKAILLRDAGIGNIQPGIEGLNTHLLQLMDKGVKARQNIALMRYCVSLDIFVSWNLLIAFPGDRVEDYEETLELIPHIYHLKPADCVADIVIHRFSPFFTQPERFGITNVRPRERYRDVFPPHADTAKLAYSFEGDYESVIFDRPELMQRLEELVAHWNELWRCSENERPKLMILRVMEDLYHLTDTRGLPQTEPSQLLNREQAALLLTGASLNRREEIGWALEKKLLFEIDGRFIPLATAPAMILSEFEEEARTVTADQEELAV